MFGIGVVRSPGRLPSQRRCLSHVQHMLAAGKCVRRRSQSLKVHFRMAKRNRPMWAAIGLLFRVRENDQDLLGGKGLVEQAPTHRSGHGVPGGANNKGDVLQILQRPDDLTRARTGAHASPRRVISSPNSACIWSDL